MFTVAEGTTDFPRLLRPPCPWDQWASIHIFSRLRKCFGSGPAIPILMYHGISPSGRRGRRCETWVSPRRFRDHMRYLQENGYQTLGLHELPSIRRPGKSVVITFDDGYQDVYRHGFESMANFGFTATLFLPVAYIGDTRRSFQSRPCLTWSEVRELVRAGMTIGSHTITHPQLYRCCRKQIVQEICHSKYLLENRLGRAIESFSYPYALPQANRNFLCDVSQIVRAAGYSHSVSSRIGRARPGGNSHLLPRLPVSERDDLRLFAAKLSGGYDWMGGLQYGSKLISSLWSRVNAV